MASVVKFKRVRYSFNIDTTHLSLDDAEVLFSHKSRIQSGPQQGLLVPDWTLYIGEGMELNDTTSTEVVTPIPFNNALDVIEGINYATYLSVSANEQIDTYNEKYLGLFSDLSNDISGLDIRLDIVEENLDQGIFFDSAVIGYMYNDLRKVGRYLDQFAGTITGDLNQVYDQLMTVIDDFSSFIFTELGDLSSYVFTEIGDVSSYLDGMIGDVSSYLEGEIGDVSSYLEGEIGDVSSYLEGEMGDLSSFLEGEVGDVSSYLQGEFDDHTGTEYDPTVRDISSAMHVNMNNFDDISGRKWSDASHFRMRGNEATNQWDYYVNNSLSTIEFCIYIDNVTNMTDATWWIYRYSPFGVPNQDYCYTYAGHLNPAIKHTDVSSVITWGSNYDDYSSSGDERYIWIYFQVYPGTSVHIYMNDPPAYGTGTWSINRWGYLESSVIGLLYGSRASGDTTWGCLTLYQDSSGRSPYRDVDLLNYEGSLYADEEVAFIACRPHHYIRCDITKS